MATFFPACADSGLRLGLGGAPLGNLFEAVTDDDARHLVQAAWRSGCRSFDTAPHYGHGLSERRLGDALRNQVRNEFVLSSKVGRLLIPDEGTPRTQHGYVNILPFRQTWDFSAAGTRRSVEDGLQRLGLARGVQVGLGGVFNSGILATGTRHGTPSFDYTPASKPWLRRTAKMETVCDTFQVPLCAAALQFALAHPAVDIVMLGARKVAEWEGAQGMLRYPVPADFCVELKAQRLIPAEIPTPGAHRLTGVFAPTTDAFPLSGMASQTVASDP